MEMITVTAKTVEDAITQASVQLGVSSDRLQYEVVEKGSAGVLGGLFGSRPAIIRAKKIETVDDKAVEFLNSVFDAMGISVDVENGDPHWKAGTDPGFLTVPGKSCGQ